MTGTEFLNAVKALSFNPSEYIVIGAGTLGVLDIREATDIDLIVSPRIFNSLNESGQWTAKHFDDGTYYLLKGNLEVGLDWDSPDSKPNLKDLKQDEMIIQGIPFASLERVKKWKLWKGTPKHLSDVELIDKYLRNK